MGLLGSTKDDYDGRKWEYKLYNKAPNEKTLNKFGRQGWELVGFLEDGAGVADIPVYIFKRPLGSGS